MNEFLTKKQSTIKTALENPFATIQALGGLSLYEFIGVMWNEVSDDPYKPNWHIRVLCEELTQVAERVGRREKKLHDIIINIPPGTTKTLLVSVMFPVWCWTRWPWMKFITGSYSSDLALESAEKSRDVMRSDKFKILYPDIGIKEDKDLKSNYRIAVKHRDKNGRVCRVTIGGGRYSTSVGGTITGFHGHINIWDDPINPKQAASEVLLKTASDWIDQSASTRKADKEVSMTILLMQRLHQMDPTGHLLDKDNKAIRHICLPGEIRNFRAMVQPQEYIKYYKDELLDTVRLSWKALSELLADLGENGYAGQIGQHPVPPGGGLFKVANFQIMQQVPHDAHIVQIIRYWDKAGTQGGGKFTVGVKIAKLINNKTLVMDVIRGQYSTENREKIIKQTAELDGKGVEVYIEQEPGSGGLESAQNTIRNLSGWICRADLPKGDKEIRAIPLSIQVNNSNVILLQGMWNKNYIGEFEYFPYGRFKDQVDASSAGFNLLSGKKQVRRIT